MSHSSILADCARGFLLGWVLLCGLPCMAQPARSDPQTEPCRAVVSKFEQDIGFLRRSMGNDKAAEIKEKLLPAKTEMQILSGEGYCGLARYIRDNKLDR